MNESSKTNEVRGKEFLDKYFAGKVIDIGCGTDPVVPHAEPFDQEQGDANKILEHLKPENYDCVHSSHCLEHMFNPEKAINDWWQLVKPGGYLITVVPHEDLYEQGVWPSRFNGDHKSTFRLQKKDTWSPCSHDLHELISKLPNAHIITAEIQDQNYDYSMQKLGEEDNTSKFFRGQMINLYKKLSEKQLLTTELLTELNHFFFQLGATIDQTVGPALAQIQIVAQKKKTPAKRFIITTSHSNQ